MNNWTTKRKITFWTHLFYVLIPTGAALVAAVNFWTFVFGEWYFALPLIASLEGVAAIGFAFRLAQVESPFVPARHFIPFFSVATLAYELGAWLTTKHDPVVGGLLTAFIVGVFGTLFIKSFGVLEKSIIDPVEAAAEKAREQAGTILVQVAEHEARAGVYREFTQRLRLADGQFQPTRNASMALADLGIDVDAEMERILAERAAQRRESALGHPFEPVGLSAGEQADVWQAVQTAQLNAQAEQLDREILGGYTQAETDCKGCFGPCGQCEDGSQAITEAPVADEDAWEQDWSEEEREPEVTEAEALAALAEKGIERLTASELMALPDSPEREAEFKRRIGNSVDRGLNWLVEKGFLTKQADASVEATQEGAGIAEEVGGVDGMGGAAEPVLGLSTGSSAVSTWECSGCEAEGSNGSKGVAKKWSAARNLGDALYCGDCRKSGKYGK